jgi:hypothetical protein
MNKSKNWKDEPYLDNYPPLKEWLRKIKANCVRQERFGPDMIETWMANGRGFVLVIRARGHGWNIYTDCDDNGIEATLRDAEKRLGIEGSSS